MVFVRVLSFSHDSSRLPCAFYLFLFSPPCSCDNVSVRITSLFRCWVWCQWGFFSVVAVLFSICFWNLSDWLFFIVTFCVSFVFLCLFLRWFSCVWIRLLAFVSPLSSSLTIFSLPSSKSSEGGTLSFFSINPLERQLLCFVFLFRRLLFLHCTIVSFVFVLSGFALWNSSAERINELPWRYISFVRYETNPFSFPSLFPRPVPLHDYVLLPH